MFAALMMAANTQSFLNPAINGQNYFATDLAPSPGTSTASVSVNSAGTVTFVGSAASATQTWLLPNGVSADYEVQATVAAPGTVSSGTLNSYLDPTQTWSKTRSLLGPDTATLTITIRNKTNTADSIAFTVQVTVEVADFGS
jgi:hypothetical protein